MKPPVKWALMGIAAVALIFAGLLMAGNSRGSQHKENDVLTVDSEPVSMEEFQAKMEEEKPEVFVYFHEKYGANQERGFWTTPFGREVPLDKLKEQTLQDLVRTKIEQIVGKEQGAIKDISYSAFLRNLAKENQRRQDAIKNNEAVYGTASVTALNYFRTTYDEMVTEVKEKLAKNEFRLSDEQIKQMYEADKETLYKVQDTITVKVIAVSAVDGNDDAKAAAEKIKSLLDKGTTIDEIPKAFSGNASVKIDIQDQVFNVENSEYGDDRYVLLSPEASKLEEGQASQVIEGDGAYLIMSCTERAENGSMPLEQVEGLIVARYVNQKYNDLIDERVQQAEVSIDKLMYDEITGE
ncbi:peptidyl-prolyl cis-trans isomerase [Paenibacillus sp. HB172176]|uniref:peptidyl-prolyl cis-trans isomerase n=1 Tax=Paenibacillus sp. HB172176 TaxID=2493690 RepID=UPI00143A2D4C|nr:peptidyl-prolyl cis-trans isomerase [Paenibacillus sp. HB172176]